jgi:putative transposase
LWVADATRIPCGEGVFRLAAVRDVFSRRIVGWKTSDRCDTDLILAARVRHLVPHRPRRATDSPLGQVELANYTSFRFSQRLQDIGIRPSMGSVGDSFDNALMENFWSTLKIELVYCTSWRTRSEAENTISESPCCCRPPLWYRCSRR